MLALTPAILEISVTSDAVIVLDPIELSVTGNCLGPATNAALAGNTACASLEAIVTTSATEPTIFQLSSTAFTVALNGTAGTWVLGVPVLPIGVPGVALSPGTSIC